MMAPTRLTPLRLAGAWLLGFALVQPAWADEQELLNRLNRLEQNLELRDRVIRNLLERINVLEDRQAGPTPADKPAPATGAAPALAAPVPAQASAASAGAPPVQEDSLAQLRASSAFERTLIQRGGLLLPPYTWELEPSVSYSHSSSDHVVIDGFTVAQVLVVGDIFNERVDRDIFQLALTTRLGLPGDSQLELRIPYGLVNETVYNAQNQESSSGIAAIGDVELALSHQFLHGSGTDASLLGSLRWKTRTGSDPFDVSQHAATFGTGYDSLQLSATTILNSDPAVFYGGLSYTANLPIDKSAGRIDPGDSFGFQAGIALSLNMDTSLSFGWEQRYTQRTKVNEVEIPGSYLNSGSLSIGVSHTTFGGRTYDVRTSIGLTRDAPDAQFTVAVPLRF